MTARRSMRFAPITASAEVRDAGGHFGRVKRSQDSSCFADVRPAPRRAHRGPRLDAGPLAEGRRFEPETDPYAVPYYAAPDAMRAFWTQVSEALRSGTAPQTPPPVDGGVPLPSARLRTLLADTSRKLTADRVVA